MNQPCRTLFAAAAVLVGLAACGSDTPVTVITTTTPVDTTRTTPPVPVVAAVQVTATPKLTVGRTGTVTASARTSQNVEVTGKTFTFSSSNTAAVTVTAGGVLTAVGPGTAVISAMVDGITGSASVSASDASLFALTVSPTSASLYITNTRQLTVSGKDSSGAAVAVRTTTWTSSNPAVATVSSTGLVTAVGLGTATINVEGVTNAAANAAASITVIPVPVASISIAPLDTILHPRAPRRIVATTRDSAGNPLNRLITYATSNVDVASLDAFGLATAQSVGPVTITASSEGKSASVRLYVVPDSGAYIVLTGGVANDSVVAGIDIPNATGTSQVRGLIPANDAGRLSVLASNGVYRARGASIGNPARVGTNLANVALTLGVAAAQPLSLGPPSTLYQIQLKPYTATISAPATVAAGALVTVSWTFDESAQPFSFYTDHLATARLYYSTANGADLTGSVVGASVTRDAVTGVSTFTATFSAPAVSGPLYIQVAADGAVATLLSPIKALGQTYRVINVQ